MRSFAPIVPWLLSGVSLLAGCRTRLLDETTPVPGFDAAVSATDLRAIDATVTRCVRHRLVATPLTELALLDGAAPQLGQAVRLRLGIPLRACDQLGSIGVKVMVGDATDFVEIVADVWLGDVDCGPPQNVIRILTLDGTPPALDNFNLLIADRAPGGTLTLHVGLGGPTMGMGCGARPVGAVCSGDCECKAADGLASCVAAINKPVCVLSCSEDADCAQLPAGRCVQGGGGLQPPFVCVAGEPGCACPTTCPFGQECGTCGCRPTPRSIQSTPCSCDSDCGDGRFCRDDGLCLLPCTTVNDCPPSAGNNLCQDYCDSWK